MINRFSASVILLGLAACLPVFAANESQTLVVNDKLQIPGAVLKAGTYTLSVESTLTDRAIVKVSSAAAATHYLLLAVPNSDLADSHNGVLYFSANQEKALRAWKCSSCTSALEFVYPKAEAVKLTDETAQSVVAVDPSYDKLPKNLSPDDMKVVTLWLLSPERIINNHTGEGVKAAKYAGQHSANVLSASNKTEPRQMASASGHRHLPKTAGNTYELLLIGLGVFSAGAYLRFRRARKES